MGGILWAAKIGVGLYGDVYLYHDTHLHPSHFFFFFCMYQLIHTSNMYLGNTLDYTSSYFIIQAIANIYRIYTTSYWVAAYT
jgi:hypothetical protein